jgi:predicted AAA+ superfamily ATPase
MFNNNDRLKLWLSRFTPQEIDDILEYVYLLKLARANDSRIGLGEMKESEYYLRKVNYTIDYITQRRIGTAKMEQS